MVALASLPYEGRLWEPTPHSPMVAPDPKQDTPCTALVPDFKLGTAQRGSSSRTLQFWRLEPRVEFGSCASPSLRRTQRDYGGLSP